MSIPISTQKKFFAGANTANGFLSYYKDILADCQRIYVIKGGSGTGKSRLMRDAAEYALGKGADVEYFYCSFDPSSLDGIIINGKTAMIDGTAPHVYEPEFPGIKEELIDLGVFWNSAKLSESAEEVIKLIEKKRKCFSAAYSYLSAAGELYKSSEKILKDHVLHDKISATAAKLVSALESELPDPHKKIRVRSAVGREGRVIFNREFQKTVGISGILCVCHTFVNDVINEMIRFGKPVEISYDPVYASHFDAVSLRDVFSFEITEKVHSDINALDFVEGLSKGDIDEINYTDAVRKDLENKASAWFRKASDIHFDIESIYISAMDFDKKEAFSKKFISSMDL